MTADIERVIARDIVGLVREEPSDPDMLPRGKTVDQLALGVHEDETGILRKAERQMTQEICFAPTLRRDNPGAFKPTLIRNVKGLLHGLRWNEFVSVVPKRRCMECPFELRQLIK